MNDLLDLVSALPGGPDAIGWARHLAALSFGQQIVAIGKLFFELIGAWEFGKYLYRWIFRRRSQLEEQVEALEKRVEERNHAVHSLHAERDRLVAELKMARDELPGAAIARADRELRDFNQDRAIGHLEDWFALNADSIVAIAKRLARFHIARSVPDPADHLKRAQDMLRLVRGMAPDDQEAHELNSEFTAVNAALQEQMIRDGERQIGWNSTMARGLSGQGAALAPVVNTLREIAQWCFEKGKWRLTPIFADRAADLAERGGRPLLRVWCQAAGEAAFYQVMVGNAGVALERVDHVLSVSRDSLGVRDPVVLSARHVRAQVLDSLGRYADALAELDALLPVCREVQGERHPDTLSMRSLRARVLDRLGRSADALAELDALLPIDREVRGKRHPGTLTTRYLRVQVLDSLGRYADALAELDALLPVRRGVQGERHPETLTTRYLRVRVLDSLGHYADALAELDALLPINREVRGERHSDTLNTRSLRAQVLDSLGRYADALAELDALLPVRREVQGERHPDTLNTRSLRARVLDSLGRYADALVELDALLPVYREVQGERHPDTLTTRYLRAKVLDSLGRYADALAELDALLPVYREVQGERHPGTLAMQSLLVGLEIGRGTNVDHTPILQDLIEALSAARRAQSLQALRARYRLARLQFLQGRSEDARASIKTVIAGFDPATDPAHELLVSARTLLDMIEGRPTTGTLRA